ncbi:CRISPR-associated protein, Csd1 family [Paracidovorax avenae ATCC 19860]|uniref:CRISPR-associated protein, Csd1 family n=1 Tax=Paracidovorax avenae (strain ATCC 19860 / DSM 7227 / CCUG 15838 / JCM 20985 / LMG 2117 / NCPPB 1011) TaxID=643561 RepID=F0Q2J4_PARA1|nr:type I-C CRISPR-associated protein Cas8c/Csd1 [Paracidovorax avenae]ADX47761.1 CRISPR-associated protein, Csd1 family [Paracidovorax avenae ATCC 19860]
MILQALATYYQRLLARGEKGLSPFGYSPEKISYEILLAPDGRVVQVNDIRDPSGKKPVPRVMNVPQPEKRTVGIKSNFLWDKTSYVLGVSATSKRADKEHEAFKALHQQSLAGTDDAGLKALSAFLSGWNPDHFRTEPFKEEMLDANVVFRLDGEAAHLHERPAAQAARARLLSVDDDSASTLAHCLVTGERMPVARLHPAIKGVNGAQSSGASLVSFNLESFTSYGKSQGENAPISEQAAFAYTTVLNHLLRRGEHNRQRLQVGDATVVFWAEAASEDAAQAAELLLASTWELDESPTDAQDSGALRIALEKLVQGRPLTEIDPRLSETTRIYVLGLAPNASRLSIRFWTVNTLGALAQNVAWHARDLSIKPARWKVMPSLWRLVLATAPSREGRAKAEDVPPQLAGELMRSILQGHRYPGSLLANTLMRMRTDGDLSDVRVAICKAVLARTRRLAASNATNNDTEEVPVSLDTASLNPGYRLGRLFAVLEAVQRSALGGQVNATIRDRYYGAASATPASVFPVLLRNTQNHLGKLRKEKPGLAVNLEKDIREIVDGLPEHFPRSLRIEDQGRFAIGYYHQSQTRFVKGDGSAAQDSNDHDSNADTTEGAPA